MAEELFDYDDGSAIPQRKDNLFLWTVLILLLIGIAFGCWIGSFYVFGHPEHPKSYRFLQKLKKIEPPKRFEVTAAPLGEFSSAKKLFEKYSAYSPLALEQENAELMRNFIKNYTETKKLVTYIRGKFEVIGAYELKGSDLFTGGTVALMQADEFPQALVEHLFPASGSNLQASKQILSPGCPFKIEKTDDVTAVIHIERAVGGRMLFTVVPLHYPSYGLNNGVGTFSSEPPLDVNLEAGVPVVKAARLNTVLEAYARQRSDDGLTPSAPADTQKRPELVRLDSIPDGAKVPTTGALPEMPVATPMPGRPQVAARVPRTPLPEMTMNARGEIPVARAVPVTPEDRQKFAAVPTIAPPAPPTSAPVATPMPALTAATPLPRVSPQGVPLTPFVQSSPQAGPPTTDSGSWRTYAAGQMPVGRAITPAEVPALADRNDVPDRLYLHGNFTVTAVDGYHAALRPEGDRGGAGSIRVIVDYPTGYVPPTEGSKLSRDSSRGFQVTGVSRANDGTVNVTVREVARP